jgi:ADP-ribose pyrophosphatase YjhB (NUDIX family)
VVIAPSGADVSDTLAGIAYAVLRYAEIESLPAIIQNMLAMLPAPVAEKMGMEDERMDVFSLLDQLRVIARNGLHYTRDGYDRERYERLMQLTTHAYAERLGLSEETLRARYMAELGHITPKVGADAAIFNQRGELLLMERADGSGWCLPCGWVEPDESPAQAAVREAREETGLKVAVERLVGVFHRPASARNGPHAMIAVVHLCSVLEGELTLSHEGLDLRYWPIEDVPVWHATHAEYAKAAFAIWKGE